jgi:hypothetical protein
LFTAIPTPNRSSGSASAAALLAADRASPTPIPLSTRVGNQSASQSGLSFTLVASSTAPAA